MEESDSIISCVPCLVGQLTSRCGFRDREFGPFSGALVHLFSASTTQKCMFIHIYIYIYIHLEHPSLPKFLPLDQNTVNVHFFLLRAFFPKPGWSVLQDDRSVNCRKEREEFEVQNERKYPQNEPKYPQTSANSKNVTMPAVLWMEEGIWSSVFRGASVFCGVEQKSVIRAFFSRT